MNSDFIKVYKMEYPSVTSSIKRKKKFVNLKNQMKNMSKEALKAALLKKRECLIKANEIVKLLIEPGVTEDVLLSNVFYINQCHFNDAIEERAISNLCGYPLCDSALVNIPRKQFHISTKTNKVYDITERKNFCSNFCYKAGIYLKDQLYTSPLWLREHEDLIQFKLLTTSQACDSIGTEIIVFDRLLVVDDEKTVENENANCQIDQISLYEESNCNFKPPNESLDDKKPEVSESKIITNKLSMKKRNLPISDVLVERLVEKVPSASANRPQATKIASPKSDLSNSENLGNAIMALENTIQSWMTIETCCLVMGDAKVKQELQSFGVELKDSKTSDHFILERYTDLCRRVNLMDLKDTYGGDKPLPTKSAPSDFNKLKEEAKLLEIKVNSFYRGDLKVTFDEESISSKISDEARLPVLPPIDHHSVQITRRNIVVQKLSKTFPEIQTSLGLAHFNFRDQIKKFASTLNLTAKNLSLKPTEWNLSAIIIIKLFSLQNKDLKTALETPSALKYLKLIFSNYNLDVGYLDRLVISLLDLHYIIKVDSQYSC